MEIDHLNLAPRQAHKSLTLWPLLRPARALEPLRCTLLAEALAEGTVLLDEVSETGAVPLARLENRGAQPVLVLFGEEIVGARQNRVANASFLVAPGTSLLLDVTCVEQGRWSRAPGTTFRAGMHTVSHDIRRRMQRDVSRAVRAGLGFEADQGAVWEDVARRMAASGTSSPTGAFRDHAERRAPETRRVLESFHTLDGQVGFVAAIEDEIVGLELLASPDLFAASFARLASGYVLDAVDRAALRGAHESAAARHGAPVDPDALRDHEGEADPVVPKPRWYDAPEPFLAALARARCERRPSRGLGDDLRLEGRGVSGCALDWHGLIHLSAFAEPLA